ncbi:MAG TPA: hypothetical protein EYG17_08475 [Acidimicrobiia bacterium]|nr:hypothetical protein [Acidimicrobiia bacterium]HIL06068.1 hypothetical protein [Acidimicrobiia bacterium]
MRSNESGRHTTLIVLPARSLTLRVGLRQRQLNICNGLVIDVVAGPHHLNSHEWTSAHVQIFDLYPMVHWAYRSLPVPCSC